MAEVTRPLRLALSARGMTTRWWLRYVIVWLLALGAARIPIPHVNPDPFAPDRSLEQLGAISLAIPIALITILVDDPTAWLVDAGCRRAWALRAGINASLLTLVALSATAVSVFLPHGVSPLYYGSLAVTLAALALLTGLFTGGTLAALTPAGLLLLHSSTNFVPFHVNLVYNPTLHTQLGATALTAATTAVILAPRARNH